jgi:DNA repair exonuclease SbcCD ATPase subunit
MIIFKKVRYKNFLSTGQQFIEINLNEAPTTLVVGHNGAGKSTMLDALCFGLFSKPFRAVKKDQLINTINEKDCIVEVEFVIGKKEYKILQEEYVKAASMRTTNGRTLKAFEMQAVTWVTWRRIHNIT